MKKTLKGWLPKYANKQVENCVTVTDLGHVIIDSSSSPDKKWFEPHELPPRRVTVTVEIED